ncbi:MAG: hypothetical protein HC811_05480 [Flammeovirgaceae bacterium]|nr:hypothetical protein [Flammeovirgaceae bacterium]
MSKNRIIFYSVFGVYQLAILIFTIVIDSNVNALLGVVRYVPALKYFALLGFLLVAADFGWAWWVIRNQKKEVDKLNNESKSLKAKMFDLQEEAKRDLASGKANTA